MKDLGLSQLSAVQHPPPRDAPGHPGNQELPQELGHLLISSYPLAWTSSAPHCGAQATVSSFWTRALQIAPALCPNATVLCLHMQLGQDDHGDPVRMSIRSSQHASPLHCCFQHNSWKPHLELPACPVSLKLPVFPYILSAADPVVSQTVMDTAEVLHLSGSQTDKDL